jgi:hypothetical protein
MNKPSIELVALGSLQEFLPVCDSQFFIKSHSSNRPDIYHSYLGLAALATMKDPALKAFDPALCVSLQQREKIARLRREALVPTRVPWEHAYSLSMRSDGSAVQMAA